MRSPDLLWPDARAAVRDAAADDDAGRPYPERVNGARELSRYNDPPPPTPQRR